MFNWKIKATNAIYLEDSNGQEGRPFKSRFLQAGLVKYDFGVCLLQKETIDKFINTFVGVPVIIDHKDNITNSDKVGVIDKIWFSPEDGWFWCSGVITDDTAVKLIEQGYNVSCQYSITDYANNTEEKLHNGNPYDKEILNGVFEHLAIVENPRYEGAYIAVNAYIASNAVARNEFKEEDHLRDEEGKFSESNGVNPNYKEELKQVIDKAKDSPNERQNLSIGNVSPQLNEEAQKHGFNLEGYTHNMDVSGVRHTLKQHGDEKREENCGQIAITDEDFEKIPEIIYNYDEIDFTGKNKTGLETITYKKQFSDGSIAYVEEIRTGRKNLTINTMYKHKNTGNPRTSAKNSNPLSNASIYIIPFSQSNFNPNATNSIEANKYNKVFDYLTTKGGTMDNETKSGLRALFDALIARNEADEKEKKEASNEDVDKRKLIDEVGGILKGKVDEEVWRTIIGKIEKVAYDKSEAGTADNKAKNEDDEDKKCDEAKNKCRNEEVDKRDLIRRIMAIAGKHEDNEDVREIAKLAEKLAYDKSEAGTADNKAKNEKEDELYEELKEKVEEEARNKKAKNSMDEIVNKLYEVVQPEFEPAYISPKKGIELGDKIYG